MEEVDFSKFDRGVFLVNVLAVVFDNGKVLIGKRENDQYIIELSWCFPGGRPAYDDDLEKYLVEEVKKKTGIDIDVKKVLFAKTYPEKREFLSIYYLAKKTGGVEQAGEKFVELKWVKPEELKDNFTTSLHPKLLEIISSL